MFFIVLSFFTLQNITEIKSPMDYYTVKWVFEKLSLVCM